jgi:hypothetical protein
VGGPAKYISVKATFLAKVEGQESLLSWTPSAFKQACARRQGERPGILLQPWEWPAAAVGPIQLSIRGCDDGRNLAATKFGLAASALDEAAKMATVKANGKGRSEKAVRVVAAVKLIVGQG